MRLSLVTAMRGLTGFLSLLAEPIHPPTRIITPTGSICADPSLHRFTGDRSGQVWIDGKRFAKCLFCDCKVENPAWFGEGD